MKEDMAAMPDVARLTIIANEMPTLAERDAMLEEMWEKMENVPFNLENEAIEEPAFHFPAGTSRDDIWLWFDQRHSKGVVYLLYGETCVAEGKRLAALSERCRECDDTTCAYYADGTCRYSMVFGDEPLFTDDGECTSRVSDW